RTMCRWTRVLRSVDPPSVLGSNASPLRGRHLQVGEGAPLPDHLQAVFESVLGEGVVVCFSLFVAEDEAVVEYRELEVGESRGVLPRVWKPLPVSDRVVGNVANPSSGEPEACVDQPPP